MALRIRYIRLIGALAVALGVALSCSPKKQGLPTETAKVVAVRDGDTVELDDGRVVRYIGIDTPEIGQFGADTATVLNEQMVLGRTVRLEYGHDRVDRYGRMLSVVSVDDQVVNLELVRQGWAWCYFFYGNLNHGVEFLRAQREAMEAKRGVWARHRAETCNEYLASFTAFRFHRPTCESVAGIKYENLVTFPSADSALYDGYAPCGMCEPWSVEGD